MTNTNKIRIIAAVLDSERLTMYKEDGTTLLMNQGDKRLADVVKNAVADIEKQGYADIDFSDPAEINSYKDFEKKTNGAVKFFRVLKAKVKHLLDIEDPEPAPVAPVSAGKIPVPVSKPAVKVQSAPVKGDTRIRTAPELGKGILTPETSVNHESFQSRPTAEDETIVAVVGETVIPNAEKMKNQLDHVANGHSDAKGLQKLFERMAAMTAAKRSHSVEDIIRFKERSDLSIADNGDIIAYKLLNSYKARGTYNGEPIASGEGIFYDIHSGLVPQRVGSLVCVDESLVDKNRRNECSSGLHVARRAYLAGFSGDSVFMIIVRPEDIITVPHGDANKVRVCAYHIVAQLSKKAYDNLKKNSSMTQEDIDTQKLLAQVIAGNHVPITEEVRIHGQKGQGVVITPKDTSGKNYKPMVCKSTDAPVAKTVDLAHEKKEETAPKVNVKEVAKAIPVVAPVAPATPSKPKKVAEAPGAAPKSSPRILEANALYEKVKKGDVKAAKALQELKTKAKVSWIKLGLSDSTPTEIEKLLTKELQATKPGKVTKSKVPEGTKEVVTSVVKNTVSKSSIPAPSKAKPKKTESVKTAPQSSKAVKPKMTVKAPPEPTVKTGNSKTKQDKAKALYERMNDKAYSLMDRQQAAIALKKLKITAKISWAALGLKAAIGDELQKLLDQKI